MHKIAGLLFIAVSLTVVLHAQDTLPRFSATARGPGKILISWHNNYPVVTQISIQRSTDSLKGFATLLTVPDPKLPANGAVDKAPHPNFYYRLFVVLDNGKYLFTPSRRPHSVTTETTTTTITAITATATVTDTTDETLAGTARNRVLIVSPPNNRTRTNINLPSTIHGLPEISISNTVFIRKGDTLLGQLSGAAVQSFRDSILRRTKDTLVFIDGDTMLIKPFIAKEVYKTSVYVFTGKLGNIRVALPEAVKRHYTVKFFDENNKLLFELAEIRDPVLILDKTNFRHAGWFRFELYDGDQLKEKNKFFIPKEF
jgi:hypothetical protein